MYQKLNKMPRFKRIKKDVHFLKKSPSILYHIITFTYIVHGRLSIKPIISVCDAISSGNKSNIILSYTHKDVYMQTGTENCKQCGHVYCTRYSDGG